MINKIHNHIGIRKNLLILSVCFQSFKTFIFAVFPNFHTAIWRGLVKRTDGSCIELAL